jgi:hypothetical protein
MLSMAIRGLRGVSLQWRRWRTTTRRASTSCGSRHKAVLSAILLRKLRAQPDTVKRTVAYRKIVGEQPTGMDGVGPGSPARRDGGKVRVEVFSLPGHAFLDVSRSESRLARIRESVSEVHGPLDVTRGG